MPFLVLDEPTAPLSQSETDQLFQLIRLLKSDGVGIIFISHRIPELYEICDDITIMRDGKLVTRKSIATLEQGQLVEYMLGSKLEGQFPQRLSNSGDICFEAKGMHDVGKVNDVSISIHKGKLLALLDSLAQVKQSCAERCLEHRLQQRAKHSLMA